MAVKNVSHRNYDWKPRSLRFGHWREGGGQVAFAGDSRNRGRRSAGLLHGHDRESAFSVLVHLYHQRSKVQVEVDEVRIHGQFDAPDDATARMPFHPRPYRDGSSPTPTRSRAYLRWREGRLRFLAECHISQKKGEDRWMLGAPYAVEADTKRLLPRVRPPQGWFFRPGRMTEGPFSRRAVVHDISMTGVGLLVPGQWPIKFFRDTRVVGALERPSSKSLTVPLNVVHTIEHPSGTIIGASFSMVGLYGIRRLGRWISDL
jgi:hypothetical protein